MHTDVTSDVTEHDGGAPLGPDRIVGASPEILVTRLGDAELAEGAMAALQEAGDDGVSALTDASSSEDHLAAGQAIVVLARIGSEDAVSALVTISNDRRRHRLVRTWAAGARLQRANSLGDLKRLAPFARSFAPIRKPWREAVLAHAGSADLRTLMDLASSEPELEAALAGRIAGARPSALIRIMLTATSTETRRRAAGYLAARAGEPAVISGLVDALAFKRAKAVPWSGGALFLPRLRLDQQMARKLVLSLTTWAVWAHVNGDQNAVKQVYNNFNSVGLGRTAGIRARPTAPQMLTEIGNLLGHGAAAEIAKKAGASSHPDFQSVLARAENP
jgi:hypothetical protein